VSATGVMMKRKVLQEIKKHGFTRKSEIIELSSVAESTLTKWVNTRPELFDVILLGCVARRKLQEDVCNECGKPKGE
jgi:hypothetical protein